MNKRHLIIASVALLLVIAAAFGLALSNRYASDEPSAAEIAEEREVEASRDACASDATFRALKDIAFQRAAEIEKADPRNFDLLAASAVARMENPVVRSREETLDITHCAGRLILELPPGAERGLEGARRLVADIEYSAQPAADGSGLVYSMTGAEPIIQRLAAFDLQGQRLEVPIIELPPFGEQEMPGQTVPGPAVPIVEPALGEPDDRVPSQTSNPSFDCRDARTRGELMVCSSDRLAELDREMAERYEEAIDDVGERGRFLLRSTRNNFLAYRDRCRDEACVAQAYQGRMAEIRDIRRAED